MITVFFCETVNNRVQSYFKVSQNDQINIDELTTCILKAAHNKPGINDQNRNNSTYKQPWFDLECLIQRKLVFKLLNLYRKTNESKDKREYINEQKNYQLLCNIKKKTILIQLLKTWSKYRIRNGTG